MTGRTLHDALLSALADARLRQELPAEELGVEEASVLRRADAERLGRMARFMARHFYRERVVRLFRYSSAVARRSGLDPVAQLLDAPDFLPLLDDAVLGSPESAGAVASRVERWFLDAGGLVGGLGYWPDLVRYEGTLFRVEAGRRAWSQEGVRAAAGASRPPLRSSSARVVGFDFDLPALLGRLAMLGPEDPLPVTLKPQPTRLLLALSPRGVLRVIRCSDALERFWETIDGHRDLDQIAAAAGMDRSSASAALKSLSDVGAVEI